ncbi:hypothetical protein PF003_g27035 [Phytophthora fragariae]|nr:hypothetical protein PF003_g27035 [Phytophthora fragariae]
MFSLRRAIAPSAGLPALRQTSAKGCPRIRASSKASQGRRSAGEASCKEPVYSR